MHTDDPRFIGGLGQRDPAPRLLAHRVPDVVLHRTGRCDYTPYARTSDLHAVAAADRQAGIVRMASDDLAAFIVRAATAAAGRLRLHGIDPADYAWDSTARDFVRRP